MKCVRIFSLLLTLCLLLSGCGGAPAEDSVTDHPSADAPSGAAADNDMFTDHDLRTDYEEAAAVTLAGSGASCDSNAVLVSGSTVTVLDEGTYLLTGSLTGQIAVDAPKDAKVQLVLRGVTVHSESSAALYVKQADKVVVTLEGENALSCGEHFTVEGQIAPDVHRAVNVTLIAGGEVLAAGESVPAARIAQAMEVDVDEIHEACRYLMDQLSFARSGIRILKLADAYQMCSSSEMADFVTPSSTAISQTHISFCSSA